MAKEKDATKEQGGDEPVKTKPGKTIKFALKRPMQLAADKEVYPRGTVVGEVTPCESVDVGWLADAIRLGKVLPADDFE